MKPLYKDLNVRAHCPDCGAAVSTFEHRDAQKEYGTIIVNANHNFQGGNYSRILYVLMRCASCHRGGLATIHDSGNVAQGALESFFPISIENAAIPTGVPQGIAAEFREAELCAAFGAYRGASALLRSTLEKPLKANGYMKGSLEGKIDEAASDGVITEARRKRAHDDIRVLGNDVLHDEWREVKEEEVSGAHQYIQRILEDFYDDRASVESILAAKGRIKSPAAGTTP
jgi:uncharacterized protein DUF4145